MSAPPPLDRHAPAAAPSVIGVGTGPSPSGGVDPNMPPALVTFLREIGEWAVANQRDATRDRIGFWALKLPAIISSAASSLLILAHLPMVSVVLAAIASMCIIIDGLNPRGSLRNAHLRAVHRLSALAHEVRQDWDLGALRGRPANELASEILERRAPEWRAIADELLTAETALATSLPTNVVQAVDSATRGAAKPEG